MNKDQFDQILNAHRSATVVLGANGRIVALPGDNALALRRAERMERDQLGTWLGVFTGPGGYDVMQENVEYVLEQRAAASTEEEAA